MLEIENTYCNVFQTFPLVKNYIYHGQGDLNDFGVLKTVKGIHSVYILQDKKNKDLAYRLYKGYKKENFDQKKDAPMIQKLHINSYNINNVDFPYGVITRENHIIGQVIPYYEDSYELATLKGTEENIPHYLIEAYYLIRELYKNHIYYLDIHEHNFLITNKGLKLVDFDNDYVTFASHLPGLNDFYQKNIITNFKRMTHSLLGYGLELMRFDFLNTMEELYEELLQLEKNHQKVKRK